MKKLILFILLFSAFYGFSQTCCSGGVPLSGNLGISAAEKGMLQFSLTYDLNMLNTLKVGREEIFDQSRQRKTYSGLLEVHNG